MRWLKAAEKWLLRFFSRAAPATLRRRDSQVNQAPTNPEGALVRVSETLTFVLDSLFLRYCQRRLTRDPNEELCLVTGVELERNVLIPSCLVSVEYEHASAAGVAAKFDSSHEQLRRLSKNGHLLQLVIHAHPGTGPDAVRESATDVAAQERLERGGYRAISGIFSRDGHVRLFANQTRFEVQIYGSGVEEVSHDVYRLC